ncbi:MAG: D-sedoheptulose 7-phosphate isomerase, partial [Desulfuromonadales bacterium]|nr:D-sedoheptulose 7-phosphate isomerase [Desulfuromonadales bacterium]
KGGHKIMTMGNGGSAADAQHFAAEMVGRFLLERKALPAIALTTDTSILTAVGNDYGFDDVFNRQVEALANPGDVLIGISTSGNSLNIKRALESGKNIGVRTVGLLGRDGGEIGPMVDFNLTIPSSETPRIQEAHLVIIHILCDLIEKGLFESDNSV